MATIYKNEATRNGVKCTITISRPETGRIYGYLIKYASGSETAGTYIRPADMIDETEVIKSIIKKSGVNI